MGDILNAYTKYDVEQHFCEFGKAIETPVARQVPYDTPDYRDPRPSS